MQIDAVATLVNWAWHISTITGAVGILHLLQAGLRTAILPEAHPVKRYGDPAVSIALFPLGILQFVSFAVYLWSLLVGLRGPATLPPEYASYGAVFSAVYGGSMLLGSASAIGQAGRKVPWAVLTGGGTAVLVGGLTWSGINGLIGTLPTLALSVGLGTIMFTSVFMLTLPWQEATKAFGNTMAFSPFVIINGGLLTALSLVSAVGLVIL